MNMQTNFINRIKYDEFVHHLWCKALEFFFISRMHRSEIWVKSYQVNKKKR